ncbi:DUF3152 domain-containing protein [Streptomyces sp. NPDC007861]|uniref:DUF3152 domain-containing protein n=1 Tax=Streptomyces sp. NPDC007861 TaxID=3154893 RepID=UPI00340976FD
MGRHSRKGPAPKAADHSNATPTTTVNAPAGGGRRGRPADAEQHTGAEGYGTPPHGTPAYGAPPYGTPAYGTPAHGVPQVRGGHPEQHEPGGGWGRPGYGAPRGQTTATTGQIPVVPSSGSARPGPPAGAGARIPGPRREFVEAFDAPEGQRAQGAQQPRMQTRTQTTGTDAGQSEPSDDPAAPAKPPRGRTFTGIAAAAVTTVLAVVVAGQVTGAGPDTIATQTADGTERGAEDDTSRSELRPAPPQAPAAPAAPPTYAQLMSRQFPLDPELRGSGKFEAVPGFDKAPGKGRKIRYRVDVEKDLGLDGKLFAEAVQKTINDDRSWAHAGAMTFERISSGEPEFVITLASPGTTATWCAKSGLDTTVDNVSCDSASTDRVMINVFRWAQGSETYGAKAMLTYRQMLINHEIGHRLGHSHVTCRTPGALAPVMQQQTKSLDIDGIKCRPNPWVFPGS